MPRKLFKRWIPSPQKIRETRALRFLGTLLHDANLFHLNRHSVSVAFAVGLFSAFLPIPGQIPVAALGALIFRCNLPIAVALVWISNPLTFPVILYANYKLGAAILQTPHRDFSFELSWRWFAEEFLMIWEPLVLGCLIVSLASSVIGYLGIQWLWRWHAASRWSKRKDRPVKSPNAKKPPTKPSSEISRIPD